jgi:hypothetical protein
VRAFIAGNEVSVAPPEPHPPHNAEVGQSVGEARRGPSSAGDHGGEDPDWTDFLPSWVRSTMMWR